MGVFNFFTHKKRARVTDHGPASSPAGQEEGGREEITLLGRTHLSGIPYVLPKDGAEEVRLNFQHYALLQVFGTHHLAPLPKAPATILDVGCGTGWWAYEMARTFPRAHVIGFDVKSSPRYSAPPVNYTFMQHTVLQPWPIADASIDYSHQRMLVGAIPSILWPFVLSEHVRVTRPGGCVEVVEGTDCYGATGPAMALFLEWGRAAAWTIGIDASLMCRLPDLLREAGLKGVQGQQKAVPLGAWGGRVGDLLAKDMHAACGSLKGFFLSTLPIAAEQFDAIIAALPEEWEHYRTTYILSTAYGQK